MVGRDFDLVVQVNTAARRKSFVEMFANVSAVHGEQYDIVEEEPGKLMLKLKPNARLDGGIPIAYMQIIDWSRLRIGVEDQNSKRRSSGAAYGVYEDPQSGELWIDGGWQNAYGGFQKQERNVRVKEAQRAFPAAKIHTAPDKVEGWNLVGLEILVIEL